MIAHSGRGDELWCYWPEPNRDAGIRLFCIPYAGSGPQIFAEWPSRLPKSVEVCGLSLPGRWVRWREGPFRRMGDLLEACVRPISRCLDKPYCIYGHSMGALIAYELARELRRRGARQPLMLFVSGCGAPHIKAPYSMHALSDDAFLDALQKLGGIWDNFREDPGLVDLVLPTLRADVELVEKYRCQPDRPLDSAITAFAGDEDPIVEKAAVALWRGYTSGEFRLHEFPGDHFFVNTSEGEFLKTLTEELKSCSKADRVGM